MTGGDVSPSGWWTVTRDGQAAFSGDEASARAFFAEQAAVHPECQYRLYRPPRPAATPKPTSPRPTTPKPTTPKPAPQRKARRSVGEQAERQLDDARAEVLRAVRNQSRDDLMPALESLVQAKIHSAYVGDGGLIDRLWRMRAALEAIDACIAPSDRQALLRPDGAAYVRIPLSAAAYRELRAALRDPQD